MSTFKIDVYSHHCVVHGYTDHGKHYLLGYCDYLLGQKEWVRLPNGRSELKLVRVFATATKDRKEFRFHRNCLSQLLDYLKGRGIPVTNFEINYIPLYIPQACEFEVNPNFQPREQQPMVIDYLSSPRPIKIVPLQTGKGKTYCASVAVANMGMRLVVSVQAMYVDKWLEDLELYLGLKKNTDLIGIRGGSDLRKLLEHAMHDVLDAKAIVVSNTTMQKYIQDYEQLNGMSPTYPVPPAEFYPVLKAGVRLIDEAHLSFHLNYKQDLYTHVPTTIDLSATITPDNPFMNRIYLIKWPMDIRLQGLVYDRYIAATAVMYGMSEYSKERLRFLRRGRQSYSHVDFEKSIMRYKGILDSYLAMITKITSEKYITRREPGQRMIIFAATVKMCEVIATRVKLMWPELVVRTFVEGADMEELKENDITVSTYQSAGTARDIPGLRITLSTTAMSTRQGNEQMLGRLRKLKDWPDVTPEFYYMICTDIPSHMKYHAKKEKEFKEIVLSHNTTFIRGGI